MIREGTIKGCDEVLGSSIFAFPSLAERIEGVDELLSIVDKKGVFSNALIADIIITEARVNGSLRAFLIGRSILAE